MTKKLTNPKPKVCPVLNPKKAARTEDAKQAMYVQPKQKIVLTDSTKRVLGLTSAFAPRQRHPDEAMPRVINMMQQPTYKPPVWAAPIR